MTEDIKLRPATIQDADLLLEWRNDPATRKASHNMDEVYRDSHVSWLSRTLENPHRKLLVAEERGVPVGTVRADYSQGIWELSWTTAPSARGRGIAKRMVSLCAGEISDPIRAEVKSGNLSSARIAEHAGMKFDHEVDGVVHFKRQALSTGNT